MPTLTKTKKKEPEIIIPPRDVATPFNAIQQMMEGLKRLPQVLDGLGFSSLRPGQDRAVKALMAQQDSVVILPTATGKSACFVVPTLCMQWRAILIYPLVALMRDQVVSMQRKGLSAASISSQESDAHNAAVLRDWASGELQFMLVSPERFANEEWANVVSQFPPDIIALDECHTFHDWADTFRYGYKVCGQFVQKMQPKVVAALSATLSEEAEKEVRSGLGIQDAKLVYHYPRRKNLCLQSLFMDRISNAPSWVVDNCEGPTIVYSSTRKRTESYAQDISRYTDRPVLFYHGGMAQKDRKYSQDKFMEDHDAIIVATNAFGMGVDKALPLTAKVLTPTGWVDNGDLLPGHRVTGRDGKPTTVTAIHDLGDVASYRVTFDDGTSTVCGGDHVWAVRTPKEKYRGKGFTGRSTLHLRERLTDNAGNHLWFIPVVAPVEFESFPSLPVHPYLLGVLLGDGGLRHNCVRFHKDDPFILERIAELLPRGMDVIRYESCDYGLVNGKGRENPLLEQLRGLGLAGVGAYDKFIPSRYLHASVTDRTLLLQGLMDTDGGPSGGGGVGAVFCTASEKLRDAVMYLARSLGGTPTTRPNGPYWQVYLMLPEIVAPFLLPRKRDRIKKRTKYEVTRCIVSIEEEAPQAMKCITVEADDGLFVTEDFVVTHNCDIRNVVHFDIPGTLVALAQEVGRAGRDGKDSYCTIIPTAEGIRTRRHFIRCGNPIPKDIKDFFKAAASMREGRSGAITSKREEIANKAGVDLFAVQAIMTFCLGENIFYHDTNAARQQRIRFAEVIPSMTKVEEETRNALFDVALEKDAWWEFDIEALAEQCDREVETVMSRLRKMHDKGYIEWVRASTRRPLQIALSPDEVPKESFDRLAEKAARAESDLQLVLDYAETADDEKHDFLEAHLNR